MLFALGRSPAGVVAATGLQAYQYYKFGEFAYRTARWTTGRVKQRIGGGSTVEAQFDTGGQELGEIARGYFLPEWPDKIARRLAERYRFTAPVDSGRLKSSITSEDNVVRMAPHGEFQINWRQAADEHVMAEVERELSNTRGLALTQPPMG